MASLVAINYFLPILAFFLVFFVVFAILKKTEVLGGNNFVELFISFALAVFFIVQVSLVDFIQFSSAWFAVIIVIVFLAFILLAFFPGKLEFLQKGWVSLIVLGLIIAFFIIVSSYTFNWAVNWDRVSSWFYTDWFGLILLLIIAAIVSWVLTKK